jgi:hypothetical protein
MMPNMDEENIVVEAKEVIDSEDRDRKNR